MQPAPITIYHNGECSKCRGALELLQEKGIPHSVRWYLAEPLTADEIRTLLHKLGIPASALVRTSEPLYQQQYEGKSLTEDQWIEVLAKHPILIQRPFVEQGEKAIVARPPEIALEFIGKNRLGS